MAHVVGRRGRLITRSGLDWTKRYGDLPRRLRARCRAARRSSTARSSCSTTRASAASRCCRTRCPTGAGNKLVFYAFDLLHLDGWDLDQGAARTAQGAARATARRPCRPAAPPSSSATMSWATGRRSTSGPRRWGSKASSRSAPSAPYQSGRSQDLDQDQGAADVGDFVIAGYTMSEAAEGLAALALGEWVDGELHYRGKVGTGFDAAMLQRPARAAGAAAGGRRSSSTARRRTIIWVRPVLSAHIHYANRTADNALRHAVFKGLRERRAVDAGCTRRRKRLISDADLATIWVTNPTRRLFGKSGPTKLDIAVYYALVGDFMLPHILGRPVSLVRCPTGKPQDCFFQRHAFTGMPPSVATFETTNSEGETKTYLSVEDAKGYLALAQFGVVEFHTWGTPAQAARQARPHRLRPRSGRGHRLARGRRGGRPHSRRARGARPRPVRQDLGRQGHPCRRAGHAEARLEEGAPGDRRHRRARSPPPRRRPSPPRWARTTASGGSSSTSTATRAAPRRPRPIRCAPAPTCRLRRRSSWGDLESIDAPEDLNYSSLPGLLTTSGDPWADIDEFRRDLPVSVAGSGSKSCRRVGDDHGAQGELEGLHQAQSGELPGAALSGDQRQRAHQLQPAAQEDPQPDQHEAGRSRARPGRALGPGQGLRIRGQAVHHHRGLRPRGGAGSNPTTR